MNQPSDIRPRGAVIPMVTIDLLTDYATGGHSLIVRLRTERKNEINKAAGILGMRQADFTRRVLINAARAVIAEQQAQEARALAHEDNTFEPEIV